ncbi:histidine phosphatase superfamily [Roridomyces roridus]|uniref:Histidine phosphatase superfamily n=1 Tax=Roridomyces roridus TaxID=1738132 RepID=A0AAD7CB98_9AGAR|nr:histidine phosphatase superfamily [Roridomyces roridus]
MSTSRRIRHGESADNLRHVWAGRADAILTNHARAAGNYFSATQFTAIHSSPLRRAHMTAQEILKQQAASPALIISPLLQEQHFGVAEGKPVANGRDKNIPLSDYIDQGLYPQLTGSEHFPEGESLKDVKSRATQAWIEILLPYVEQASREGTDVHVAVVSHGIFIKQALRALRNQQVDAQCEHQWLRNTAWARVVVGFEDESTPLREGTLPPLQVQLTKFNECEHAVKRQKGGAGREAYDARQKDIRGFFGGSRKPGGHSN